MNILVPTDFSLCAEYALEAAKILAGKTNAVIHLIHVVEPTNAAKSDYIDKAMVVKEIDKNKENALILMSALHDTYNGPTYKIYVETGNVTEVVKEYSDKIDADLILVGSHGSNDKSNLYMGSNAQKIVRNIKNKVMVVKQSIKNLNLKEVVFASDFNTADQPAMSAFSKFVQAFADKVHLVYINTNLFYGLPMNVIKDVMKDAESHFSPLKVETHYFNDYGVEEGINRISESLNVGLIGISNISKHPLKRIFSGSNVEALVNHSELPVLSVDIDI